MLTLDDAAKLVAARGRLMQAARSGGAMIAVEAAEEEVLPYLEGRAAGLSVAAVNGPASVVISGDEEPALEVAELLRASGRRTKRLTVSHAFHSPHMDGVLDAFREVASTVAFSAPTVPIVSTVTGRLATEAELTSPQYWANQIRAAVRFLDAARELAAQGATVFVEAGPDAVLTALTRAALEDTGATAVPLMRAGRPEAETLTLGLGAPTPRGPPWTRRRSSPARPPPTACRRTPSGAPITGWRPRRPPTPAASAWTPRSTRCCPPPWNSPAGRTRCSPVGCR